MTQPVVSGLKIIQGNVTLSSPQQTPSLFNRYRLEECFSKNKLTEARTNSEINKEIAPYFSHYLCALNDFEGKPKEALESIQKHMNKKPPETVKELINTGDPEHGLTCLHITVIREIFEGSKELIKRGASINAEDNYGFTPWLHTALLVNYTAIKKLLEQHGANQDEAKWQHLRRQAGLESNPEPNNLELTKAYSLSKCCYKDAEKDPVPLTQDFCKDVLGLEAYTDEIFLYSNEHHLIWKTFKTFEKEKEYEFSCQKEVENLLISRDIPLLHIRPNSQIRTDLSRGLYAAENLQEGTFIGWYAGRLELGKTKEVYQDRLLKGPEGKEYCFTWSEGIMINPYKIGNYARFINDSWPNVVPLEISNKGMAFITTQTINQNEELFFNYGPGISYLKWGKYTLLQTQEIAKFFGENSIKDIVSKLKSLDEKLKISFGQDAMEAVPTYISFLELKVKLVFLYTTPSALIYLYLVETLKTAEEVQDFLKDNFVRGLLDVETYIPHYQWMVEMLSILEDFNNRLGKDKEMGPAIRTYFLELLTNQQLTVPQILKGLKTVADKWSLSGRAQEWNSIKEELNATLKNFRWEKDKRLLSVQTSQGLLMDKVKFTSLFSSLRLF